MSKLASKNVSATSSGTPVIVHWFRRDLRLEDQTGFSEALKGLDLCSQDFKVLPLFIFDASILGRLEDKDDPRVSFIHQTLCEMKAKLAEFKSDVLCLYGNPVEIWRKILANDSEVLGHLSGKIKIVDVTVGDDYEPSAIRRDAAVQKVLESAGVRFHKFKDQVIFEKQEVTKDDGKPYTVFTPYSRKWRARLETVSREQNPLAPKKCGPGFSKLLEFQSEIPTLESMGFTEKAGFDFPGLRVETSILTKYAELRNTPSIRGTSRLGLHLRFGTVSPRRLVQRAMELNAETWLSELIWREFFMQILWHFPHVVEGAFRPEYDRITWRNDEMEFEKWCRGETGYPIVDAGMRELNETGFMHNRVRMIAASFLVKHLLVDWRWGEAYFARKLLDFDLSANNGNWQWVAGSGCDAAPYFRVFNPELQAKKFDPKNEYIKKWVPEFGTSKAQEPMVVHAEARARVLRAYAAIKQ